MARPPRLVVPDIALHVRQRGVDRQDCFRADTDRLVYLSHLRQLLRATRCALHAYCLMTNHVHLLLTPPDEASCGILMRELGQRYVPYFNRRYGRTGTLWEGRFKSCLVDSARYVLGCYHYIEMNPVAARMVPSALAYPWSSYAANVGVLDDECITPHVEYAALGSSPPSRRAAYQELFRAPPDPELVAAIRDATYGGYALVGDELKARLVADGRKHVERGTPGPRVDQAIEADPATAELDFGGK